MRRLSWCVVTLAFGASCGRCVAQQAPVSTPVDANAADVRLESENGRTQFKLGEPIKLELVFTSRTKGFFVNTTDYGDMAEEVTVTPADGWFRAHGKSGHDYYSSVPLGEEPIRVPVLINQGIIFQKPGRFEISVTTFRLDQQRTTNAIAIEILPADDREEAELVRSLSVQISTTNGKTRHAAADQLAFLGGDEAVRAKIFWLAKGNGGDSVQREMMDGLASSRNLELQLELLQAVWRDVHHVPDSSLLSAMQQTRAFMRKQTLPGWQMSIMAFGTDPAAKAAEEERQHDASEIVETLPQRTGNNRRDTAYFLMEYSGLSKDDEAKVRPVVIEEFKRMDPLAQAMLLETRWKNISDPMLAPELEAMLDATNAPRYDGIAIERLIELSPEVAKPYAVREICDPKSGVQMKQIQDLPDEVLPEVDACLTEQLRASTGANNLHRLWKADIAARFGSEAMLPAMKEIYEARKNWNEPSEDSPFLAYFLRYSPKEAMGWIDVLGANLQGAFFEIDNVFAARKARFPKELDAWLRLKLEKGADREAEWATYQLSRFGEASDKLLVEKKLEALRKVWAGRGAEMDAAQNGEIAANARAMEADLVSSLIGTDKVWSLTVDEKSALLQACLTSQCKRYAH
jgi:hypothetical protein